MGGAADLCPRLTSARARRAGCWGADRSCRRLVASVSVVVERTAAKDEDRQRAATSGRCSHSSKPALPRVPVLWPHCGSDARQTLLLALAPSTGIAADCGDMDATEPIADGEHPDGRKP